MLFAVLETAIRDYEYLESIAGRRRHNTAQNKRIRSMVEDNHPREFFDSKWFEEICHLLGLNHVAVRATIFERIHDHEDAPIGANSDFEGLPVV